MQTKLTAKVKLEANNLSGKTSGKPCLQRLFITIATTQITAMPCHRLKRLMPSRMEIETGEREENFRPTQETSNLTRISRVNISLLRLETVCQLDDSRVSLLIKLLK